MTRLVATMLAACIVLAGCFDPDKVETGPRPNPEKVEELIRKYHKGDPEVVRDFETSGLGRGWYRFVGADGADDGKRHPTAALSDLPRRR